jgi:hypothetical protein
MAELEVTYPNLHALWLQIHMQILRAIQIMVNSKMAKIQKLPRFFEAMHLNATSMLPSGM